MTFTFRLRFVLTIALLLFISGAKTSYAYPKENVQIRTERAAQFKRENRLQDDKRNPAAIFLQTLAEASNSIWQSSGNGGSGAFSGKIPYAKFYGTLQGADVEFNFIRWHLLHQLIQQSHLRGRYFTHGFW